MHRETSLTGKPGARQRRAISLPADRSSLAEKGVILSRVQSRPCGGVFGQHENNAGSRAGSLIANTMGGSALSILTQTDKEDRREEP